MSEDGLKNYVVVPRQIAADYRNGLITRAERDIYLWMRINANPYAIAYMSLESVAQDVLGSSNKNYANKILLSLKSKRYIFYEQRSGRRGTFEVHFGDWILPTRNAAGKPIIKNLDSLFNNAAVRRKKIMLNNPQSELYAENDLQFQRFGEGEYPEKTAHSEQTDSEGFRAADNDTENETDKEIETSHRFAKGKSRDLSLEEFVPVSYEEEICHDIAKQLREPDMRFLIGSLKKHGIQVVEKSFIKLQRAMKKGDVDDPRRLFNYIIQQAADPETADL